MNLRPDLDLENPYYEKPNYENLYRERVLYRKTFLKRHINRKFTKNITLPSQIGVSLGIPNRGLKPPPHPNQC